MHIGVDVDGVLRRLVTSIRQEFIKDFPQAKSKLKSPKNLEFWDIRKVAKNSKLGKIVEKYALEKPESSFRCFRNADPFAGEIAAMERLYHDAKFEDHIVSICTSQYEPWHRRATLGWIQEHEIPHDNIIFNATDKGIYGLDALLDDRAKNCKSVEQSGGVGALKLMKYNENNRQGLSYHCENIDVFREAILKI
jgi:5'(3')-deoxyribonucleotidase